MTDDKRLPLPEFIALVAMNFAMVAFSVDGMLPALPEIAAEISPEDRNRAQLVLTSFVLGMGVGTLFAGPLSDTFGRKPVILAGAGLFVLGAGLAANAQTMDQMIAARILQGLGVSGPRIVTLAIVRDLYEGRRMAQIMSYAMLIFTLVPAAAPYMGALIIDAYGWRAVFVAFILFCLIVTGWMGLRQPETLPHERRRDFRPASLWAATKECFSNRAFTLSTAAQVMTYGILFGDLSSVQQIFDEIYGRGETFPEWFALVALLGGVASIINARVVMAIGMRRMIEIGMGGQAILSAIVLILATTNGVPFAVFLIWNVSIFFMAGLVIGNLNALAMEPVGHIAGLASSVIGAVATVLGVALAIPLGLMFDGTLVPLAGGIMVLSLAGFGLIRKGLR
ncbi:multidrug effflux MFS transporter [uncultured Litoreibacter sp.]|uniref:multidrug effflux MFS transporter n=1 Tax=uncultured Litoreibacter sp. TaxID=1392394 RepID=UPI002635B3CD|nr:multidrug effflux MFS transporter [uncultured Litoreibacter sp.]